MMGKRAALVLLVALLGGLVAAPLAASAAPQRASAKTTAANPLAGIAVSGTARPSSGNGPAVPFAGTLTVTRFAHAGNHLVATGTLVTTLTTAAGSRETVATQVTVPLQATGTCPILHLDIGPINLNLLGLVITTSEIVVDVTAVPGPGNLLGNLLCSIANLLNGNGGAAGLVTALLNRLLSMLIAQAATTPALGSIPLTGRTASGATVPASLSITGFANQGGHLVALGTVQTATGSAQVTLPLQATTTCPILHLVIGPINLNLLGLVITTNQITLDITAVPGPGNLLGNLLCGVANLLNNPGALSALLNQILQLLLGLGGL